jgi:ribosome biogenesis GTPase
MKGRVFKSTGSWYTVKVDNRYIQCRLRGKLRLDEEKVTNPITVGDWVGITMDNDSEGIIHEVLPRENYIIRKSTRKKKHSHRLAANIDQAVVVVTLVAPRTSLGFIDRFLVACESFRIPALLAFNKSDLLDSAGLQYYEELKFDYQELGYKTLLMSAATGEGIQLFKEELTNKTSLIAGHSGVGKSTLLNLLSPEISQRTAEISEAVGKGIHTTTFAEMFEVWENTYVIDTPGIKELGLWNIKDEELSHYFPEMRKYIGQCKYYNCTHIHEPDCAFRAAMEEGKIAPFRYENYLSMLKDDDNRR